jgi:hypothetical protein
MSSLRACNQLTHGIKRSTLLSCNLICYFAIQVYIFWYSLDQVLLIMVMTTSKCHTLDIDLDQFFNFLSSFFDIICISLIIPRVGKVMSIIFVLLSRMSPTLEFEYECATRVIFSSVGDMSENTTKIVYLNLTKSGIRGTIH